MRTILQYLNLLAGAVLLGKTIFLSFIVAPILARNLERATFGKVVRQLFPAYYALGIGAAVTGLLSAGGLLVIDGSGFSRLAAGGIWLSVLVAEAYCRWRLTPQSNEMRDRLHEQERHGEVDPILQSGWNRLHQRSVYLNTLVLIAGMCLIGFAR